VIGPAVDELAELTSTAKACALLGRPRASHYRAQQPDMPRRRCPRPAPPNALTEAERQRILQELNSANGSVLTGTTPHQPFDLLTTSPGTI